MLANHYGNPTILDSDFDFYDSFVYSIMKYQIQLFQHNGYLNQFLHINFSFIMRWYADISALYFFIFSVQLIINILVWFLIFTLSNILETLIVSRCWLRISPRAVWPKIEKSDVYMREKSASSGRSRLFYSDRRSCAEFTVVVSLFRSRRRAWDS